MSLKLFSFGLATLVACSGSSLVAQVITDDFNDGNEEGWTHYDPIGGEPEYPVQGIWSFPNGGYRLQAAESPAPATIGPARIGSTRSEVYSDFYLEVDVLAWNDSVDQSFGLIARLTDGGLFTTKCYLMTYQTVEKNIVIDRITDEGGDRIIANSGNSFVTLVPGRHYRFTFTGKGALLSARVFELPDTATPVAEISGTDTDPYLSGITGLIIYNISGLEGAIADATFDNYHLQRDEPPRIIPPPRLRISDTFFGTWQLSWPSTGLPFTLQTSTVLSESASDWSDVPAAEIFPPTDGDPFFRYDMSVATESGGLPKQFFRLIRREGVPE